MTICQTTLVHVTLVLGTLHISEYLAFSSHSHPIYPHLLKWILVSWWEWTVCAIHLPYIRRDRKRQNIRIDRTRLSPVSHIRQSCDPFVPNHLDMAADQLILHSLILIFLFLEINGNVLCNMQASVTKQLSCDNYLSAVVTDAFKLARPTMWQTGSTLTWLNRMICERNFGKVKTANTTRKIISFIHQQYRPVCKEKAMNWYKIAQGA